MNEWMNRENTKKKLNVYRRFYNLSIDCYRQLRELWLYIRVTRHHFYDGICFERKILF